MRTRGLLIALLLVAGPAAAQQRPLTTQTAEVVQSGEVLAQFGVEFLQNATFPLSGLSGDLTRAGVLDLHFGISRRAEFQVEGVIRNFLSVSEQVPGAVTPNLSRGDTSTSDFGDFALAGKFQLLAERELRPAIGFRFGFEMPNSDEAKGIGLNTTNVFATILAQKHFGKLNVFGQGGVAILEAPAARFTQNDVAIYGLAFVYPVHHSFNIVAEVAGRYSSRDTPPDGDLVGTGSRSQARLGAQIFAGGLRWEFAGIAGLTRNDADVGFVVGVSKSFNFRNRTPGSP